MSLISLPPELILHIASYLHPTFPPCTHNPCQISVDDPTLPPRPHRYLSSLHSLSLVSRYLHALITPILTSRLSRDAHSADLLLLRAIDTNQPHWARLALSHNANPELHKEEQENSIHRYCFPPLERAAYRGSIETCVVLLDHGVSVENAVAVAIMGNRVDTVRVLLSRKEVRVDSEMFGYAAKMGSVVLLDLLCEFAGEDVSAKEEGMAEAVRYAVLCGYEDCLRWLLERGAGVERCNKHDTVTPLMNAAFKLDVAMVRMLLSRGAMVGGRDSFGRSAIEIVWDDVRRTICYGVNSAHIVGSWEKGYEITRMLLQAGVDKEQYKEKVRVGLRQGMDVIFLRVLNMRQDEIFSFDGAKRLAEWVRLVEPEKFEDDSEQLLRFLTGNGEDLEETEFTKKEAQYRWITNGGGKRREFKGLFKKLKRGSAT